ncbi:hypothetical protein TNCV_4990841 [Trichonephila clavipes]|nr:hypothetical protein TNCV_4990841 [Trichonephila clavipes]
MASLQQPIGRTHLTTKLRQQNQAHTSTHRIRDCGSLRDPSSRLKSPRSAKRNYGTRRKIWVKYTGRVYKLQAGERFALHRLLRMASEATTGFFVLLGTKGKKETLEWCMKANLIASRYECPRFKKICVCKNERERFTNGVAATSQKIIARRCSECAFGTHSDDALLQDQGLLLLRKKEDGTNVKRGRVFTTKYHR